MFTDLIEIKDMKSQRHTINRDTSAFITSEPTAFQTDLFLPFLVIDMVIASILMSLGMMMLSPMLVALPFKLLLFFS